MSQELNAFTEAIIGCAYTVGNNRGQGFIEKIYETAIRFICFFSRR